MQGLEHTPKIGIFYLYNNQLIAPAEYQKSIDLKTRIIIPHKDLKNPGEYRDLWDNYMVKKYPELVKFSYGTLNYNCCACKK